MATGCTDDDDDNDDNQNMTDPTSLRIAHLVPAGANARLCLYTDGGVRGPTPRSGDGIAYGQVSDYLTEDIVAQTAYTFKLVVATRTTCPALDEDTDVIVKGEVNAQQLLANGQYTLNVLPQPGQTAPQYKFSRDDENVPNDQAKIRFTHAATAATAAGPNVTLCYDDEVIGEDPEALIADVAFGQTSAYSQTGAAGAAIAEAFVVAANDPQGCEGTKLAETDALGTEGFPASALINIWAIGDATSAVEQQKIRLIVNVNSFE